jgi:hypothetical protein
MEKQHIRKNIRVQSWHDGELLEAQETTTEPKRSLPEVIKNAREAFEKKLQDKEFKPTLAEYLKLLQFEQEMTQKDELPREITVTWVEPESDCSAE